MKTEEVSENKEQVIENRASYWKQSKLSKKEQAIEIRRRYWKQSKLLKTEQTTENRVIC